MTRPPRELSDEEWQAICAAVREGRGWQRLALQYHVSNARLTRMLREAGFVQCPPMCPAEKRRYANKHAQIRELHAQGLSAWEIARRLEMTGRHVRRLILQWGLELPARKHPGVGAPKPERTKCKRCGIILDEAGSAHVVRPDGVTGWLRGNKELCGECLAMARGWKLWIERSDMRREEYDYQGYAVHTARAKRVA